MCRNLQTRSDRFNIWRNSKRFHNRLTAEPENIAFCGAKRYYQRSPSFRACASIPCIRTNNLIAGDSGQCRATIYANESFLKWREFLVFRVGGVMGNQPTSKIVFLSSARLSHDWWRKDLSPENDLLIFVSHIKFKVLILSYHNFCVIMADFSIMFIKLNISFILANQKSFPVLMELFLQFFLKLKHYVINTNQCFPK